MSSRKLQKILLILTVLAIFGMPVIAQDDKYPVLANVKRDTVYTGDSVYVVADIYYKKGGTSRWLLGDHYRKDWITPIKVPVVQLQTAQGGLKARKEGGGKQTQSLRLQSVTDKNRQYVLRSVEKYPERALPAEFANTFVTEFVKDQITSANPYAPLVAAALAESAGIYHTNPRMVYIPHSPALAEFDSTFGNRFYLMEERPDGNWQDAKFFGFSQQLVSTDELAALIMKDPAYRVDQTSFLRARLLDLLIGDWDRHEDQWAWAGFKEGNTFIFKPVPKDRDQAFAKLDGVLPWLGTRKWALRRTQHFGKEIKDLGGLTWSARNIDRAFLNDLEWHEWEVQVERVQKIWTDEVLEQAVRKLPDTIYKLSGEEIKNKLISRRNDLAKYAKQHYKALAERVEWVGTAAEDAFLIEKLPGCSVRVSQTSQRGSVTKERLFTSETKELRFFGSGGDDKFVVRDSGNNCKTKIRLIGESGEDLYTVTDGKKTVIYDTSRPEMPPGKIRWKKRFDTLTHVYRPRSYQYNSYLPVLLPGYNPDDGIFLGGGVTLTKQKWGHAPFAQRHFIAGNYAFATGAFNFLYDGLFNRAIGPWDAHAALRINQPDYVLNFYGLGNNTEIETDDRNFNRVRVKQVLARAGIQRTLHKRHWLMIESEFLSTKVESIDKRFVAIGNSAIDSSDFESTNWFGGVAGYSFTTIDNPRFPSKGVIFNTNIRYLYSKQQLDHLWNNESNFSFFVPLGKLVFASRLGGAALSGDPQFFQYNQLGGTVNLRGYRRSRFSGKFSFYNNNELRIPITNITGYIIRGKLGITLFCDNGRVWMPDEDSNKWHVGYGGGIWIIPFGRLAFTAHYGVSREENIVTVRTGFLF
jgi:hypothetical protein